MAVINDYHCIEHGYFESTHPICSGDNCLSEHVELVFLKAPMIGSSSTRRFDAGIRQSADAMHISNFRSAREGEASYGGDAATKKGMEILWGPDAVAKHAPFQGRTLPALMSQAAAPLRVTNRKGEPLPVPVNNGMRQAATDLGLTARNVPKPGSLAVSKAEKGQDAQRTSSVASRITA